MYAKLGLISHHLAASERGQAEEAGAVIDYLDRNGAPN
jgi:hypothetical protein